MSTEILQALLKRNRESINERKLWDFQNSTGYYISQLSITVADFWDNQFRKRKGSLWLTVLEVSAHTELAVMILGLWWSSTSWQGAYSREKPVIPWLRYKREQGKRLESPNPFQGHSHIDLKHLTMPHPLKTLPTPNRAILSNNPYLCGSLGNI
jgi:hypothetical protein